MTSPRLRIRSFGLCAAAVLAAASLVAPAVPAGTAQAQGAARDAQVDRPLNDLAARSPRDTVRVIVQGTQRAAVEKAVAQQSGKVRKALTSVGGLSVDIQAGRIADLAKQPGVKRIAVDPPVSIAAADTNPTIGNGTSNGRGDPAIARGPDSVFAESVGARALWARGITGKGVSIAIIDSGIRSNGDLTGAARITGEAKFNADALSAADQYGHGTWVAGIAAGDGSASGGKYMGMAPGASIVNLKVSDDTGRAYTSDVIEAIGWAVQHRRDLNIRVLNLSLVSTLTEGYATNILDAAVEMAWLSGIVVVASAGNGGPGAVRTSPANDPFAIVVGATDDAGTASPLDDVLATFSASGPTGDRLAKPDLVAPGRRIIGALANAGTGLARQYPNRVIGRAYIQLSGTSASAPIVSGAAALLLQARPGLTPNQVKWLLTTTARSVKGPAAGVGAGQVDVQAAASFPGPVGASNRGLVPNRLVAQVYFAATRQSGSQVSWDSVSWDSVSWDSVSWDSVSWDSVSWDSVSWDSVSWDSVLGD